MRLLCATVLIFEAIVIALAIPVAITIEHEPRLWAGVAGGVLAGIAVLSVLQLGIIAAGLVVPAMYALGAVFAALWAVAIWLGLRYREAPRP